ncbi:MAG: dethiobiotin synthase [Acidimicrobiia bacterium]
MTLIVVTGTGTDIGKTWVTAAVATALRQRGLAVAARKPVQSFAPEHDAPTDAEILADATGEDPHVVCPAHRWLPRAMAPPMAAEALGSERFTFADLATEITQSSPRHAIVLVESVGGVRSPLASDGDTVALVAALRPALVVLVADAALGTINVVRLSVDVLRSHRVIVYLNRYDSDDELHVRNHDWLVTREGLEIVTNPDALADLVAPLAPSG